MNWEFKKVFNNYLHQPCWIQILTSSLSTFASQYHKCYLKISTGFKKPTHLSTGGFIIASHSPQYYGLSSTQKTEMGKKQEIYHAYITSHTCSWSTTYTCLISFWHHLYAFWCLAENKRYICLLYILTSAMHFQQKKILSVDWEIRLPVICNISPA